MKPNYKSPLQNRLETFGFDFSLARSQLAFPTAVLFLIASWRNYTQQQAQLNWSGIEDYITSAVTSGDIMQIIFILIFPIGGSVLLVYSLLGFAFSRSR